MLQLIFSVCSIVHGASCRELAPVPLQEGTSIIGCIMATQIEGAKWAMAHPNYYIAKATCQPVGQFAKL